MSTKPTTIFKHINWKGMSHEELLDALSALASTHSTQEGIPIILECIRQREEAARAQAFYDFKKGKFE